MKRCSQCDFIYEDDQNLCDMDGHELVYEPTLQALQLCAVSAAAKPLAQPDNSRAIRHQALAATVAVLIAAGLSIGYSGLTGDYAPQNTKAPATNVIPAPQSAPDHIPATPAVSPTPSPSASPQSEKARVRPTVAPPVRNSTPSLRSTSSRGDAVRSQPAKANHKKESGIGGFLKKTGKMLKRPFER